MRSALDDPVRGFQCQSKPFAKICVRRELLTLLALRRAQRPKAGRLVHEPFDFIRHADLLLESWIHKKNMPSRAVRRY